MTTAGPDARPNIVLINCDDLGYGDLGCYGSTVNDTPHSTDWPPRACRFDRLLHGVAGLLAVAGALLTGCYPPRIGFGSFDGLPVLFPGQPVGLAGTERAHPASVLLRDAGYRDLMLGKWHCGDQPGSCRPSRLRPLLRPPLQQRHGSPGGHTDFDRRRRPARLPAAAPARRRPGDRAAARPVRTDRAATSPRPSGSCASTATSRSSSTWPTCTCTCRSTSRSASRGESANGDYGAAVAAIDWATDAILHELAALGLDERTIVVFTSDNGALERPDGGSNAPLRGHKGSTWDGGQRVPAIVRWPGRISPGRTVSEVASAMDLLPTFASLAGAPLAEDRVIDGVDLAPLLLEEEPTGPGPRGAFAFYFMDDLHAVRSGRWKLHVARDGRPCTELYDLETDIGETTDVQLDHPDVVRRLETIAEQHRAELGDARVGRRGAGVRPIGRVPVGRPLTTYDPDHPYYAAEYDLADRG
jgi:arylsulfatase A